MVSLKLAISLLVVTVSSRTLRPIGPPCPLGDGMYAVGCSQRYLQCVNGQEYERRCPDGLYFDRILSRCERRSNNNLCKNKDKNVANVRQKAVVIDCDGRDNGNYAIDRQICDENYYQCSNAIGYMRKCPYQQYYSHKLKRCDYFENCQNSIRVGGVKAPASAHFNGSPIEEETITTDELDPAENGINCELLENATISRQLCSPFFFQCAQGKLYKKGCPKGLFYDLDGNICDYPKNTKGCADFEGVASSNYPLNDETGSPPAPPPPVSNFDCQGKIEGFHALGFCQDSFVSCIGGFDKTIHCAANLVYDARINACDYPEACKGERLEEDVPNLFNHGGIVEKKEKKEVKVDFNCSTKADGLYVNNNCDNVYYQCNNKNAFLLNCPSDLVFNLATRTCDFANNCSVNYEVTVSYYEPPATTISTTTSTSATTTTPETTTVSDDEAIINIPTSSYEQPTTLTTTEGFDQPITTTTATTPVPTTTTAPIDFNCDDVGNGNYASGKCLNVFYQCWNGHITATRCPSSLVFNPYNGECDYDTNVIDCENFDESLITTSTTTQSSTTTTTTTTTAEPETTPSNSYDQPSNIDESTITSTTTSTTTATPTTSTTTGTPTTSTTTGTPTTSTTTGTPTTSTTTGTPATTEQYSKDYPYCERLADGTYGFACSRFFYICHNSETTKVRCQPGLFFNVTTSQCDWPENIEDCRSANVVAADVTSSPAVTTTVQPSPARKIPKHAAFSCAGRVDGIYALPYCTDLYVQCLNGQAIVNACASGLYYSETSGLCDYKERVSICNGTTIPVDQIEDTKCVGKPDGYYSNGCSSHYFSCIGEKLRKMICPLQLTFSQKKTVCDYPDDVEECRTNIIAPPAAPSDACISKTDGIYEFAKCSPNYIHCRANTPVTGTCATPLIYNPSAHLCDYKSNNPDCSADDTVSTTTSSY